MKKLLSMILSLVMLTSVVCFNQVSVVSAAEIIPVYLNGELLTFPASDAQPQIYQNRTYVPIRVTAEMLGMHIDWNSKTETMTFSRNGLTIDHTMRSNIVYVSGNALTFDTPSINVQNRTLMPIRMLGESIGGTVEWDNDKRCVYITTNDTPDNNANNNNNNNNNNNSTNNNTVDPLVAKAEVTNILISTNSVKPGEKVKITVTAKNATRVKLVDNNTKTDLAEIKDYKDNEDGTRTFTTNIDANNETSSVVIVPVYAYAGVEKGYNEDSSKIRQSVFVVNPDEVKKDKDDDDDDGYKSDYMVSYKIEDKTIEKGDYAKLTVTTKKDVEKVRVTNSFNSVKAESNTFEKDGDNRVFEVKTRMNTKGSGELYVHLYLDGSGYEDTFETIKVKVTDEDDDDDKVYDELEIVEIEQVDDIVYKGEETTVIVYTSTDTEEVAIFDENDDRVVRSLYPTGKKDGMLVWHLTFEVNHSGKEKYTVKIYNDDDDEEKETIRIEGENYSNSDLVVLSVVQKSDDVKEGDSCRFDARTTSSADYIVVTTSGGKEIEKVENSSKSGSLRKFSFEIDIDDIDDSYYVYAYDDDGGRASKKFKVIGETSEEVSINNIEVEDSTVDENDDIEVTIYTSNNVEKLWIEDDEGNRATKKTKPTDKDGDEYIWELSFEPEITGRVTYTVFVEDEDDNTDERDFRVTVED